jgi:plasmid maintenance system antidote protein VapI
MNRILKAKMIEKFGSQIRFAHTIGEDESNVSRVVNGWRSLTPTEHKQWADVLGCSPEDIFKDTAN